MEEYMYLIALITQINIRSIYMDLLYTHMACGASVLNPINSL